MGDSGKSLEDVTYFIFDLDHTVWHWNRLIPGVADTISRLRSKGKQVFFLTNNSLLTREGFAHKLSELGIDTKPEHVVSSPYVAAQALSEEGVDDAYVIGEQGLVDELESEHVNVHKESDDVVVGFDRNFNYWKMAQAAKLIREGAEFWTTGEGATFQAGDKTLPGDKPIVESIKVASGEDSVTKVGKPSEYMADVVREEFPIFPANTVLIGDHIETDIVLGNRLNIKTGLVLGGASSREDLQSIDSSQAPDYVFKKFDRILRKV